MRSFITRFFLITIIFSLIIFSRPNLVFSQEEATETDENLTKEFIAQGPFNYRTQSPIYLLFFMPKAQRAKTIGANHFKIGYSISYANNYETDDSPTGFSATFDFESLRSAIDASYGITDWLEVALEIPFIHHQGGHFDNFLQDYHDAFNFPNGGRDLVSNGVHQYFVSYNGIDFYRVNPTDYEIGDINLSLKLNAIKEAKAIPAISFFGGIKFPTGHVSEGVGSGRFDGTFGMAVEKSINRFHFYGNIYGVFIQEPNPLKMIVDGEMFGGMFGGEVTFLKRFAALVQVQGNSDPFITTGVKYFDNGVLDIVFGFKARDLLWIDWELAMQQNLITASSNDVAIHFGVSKTF